MGFSMCIHGSIYQKSCVLHKSVVKFVTKITPKRYDFHASKHRSANYIYVDSSLVRLVMHWNLQKIRWTWKYRRQNVSNVKTIQKNVTLKFLFYSFRIIPRISLIWLIEIIIKIYFHKFIYSRRWIFCPTLKPMSQQNQVVSACPHRSVSHLKHS